jgi:DNA-binding CsgD family transcriptional regulator
MKHHSKIPKNSQPGDMFSPKPQQPAKTKKIEISETQVERLASVGCNNTEIAHVYGVSEGTIRNRFTKILTKGRANRKAKLRELLWASAEKGNVTMQIWLSKVELGFSEKSSVHISTDNSEKTRAIEARILEAEKQSHEMLQKVVAGRIANGSSKDPMIGCSSEEIGDRMLAEFEAERDAKCGRARPPQA